MQSLLRERGARPRTGHEAIEIHTALGLVAAELGYALVGASVAIRGPQDLQFLSLPEITALAQIAAVSRDGEQNVPAATMLATLRMLVLHPVGSEPRRRRDPAGVPG